MSYSVWTVDGYGINITKTISSLTPEKWEQLKHTVRSYWEAEEPYNSSEFPGALEYLDMKTNIPQEADVSAVCDLFSEYSNEEECIRGFDALVADTFTWLWKKNGHDSDLITTAADEFHDNEVFWMIRLVYPWYNGERFENKAQCTNAITQSLDGFINEKDIDFRSIEQGG